MKEKTTCPMAAKVSSRVLSRAEIGLKKYGVNADRDDLSILQWLQHLQEELLDASIYLEKLKKEVAPTGEGTQPPAPRGLAINPSMKNLERGLLKDAEAVGYRVGAVFAVKFSKFTSSTKSEIVKVLGPDDYKVKTSEEHLLSFSPSIHLHRSLR